MDLQDVVVTHRTVSRRASRKEKIDRLAQLVSRASPEEAPIVATWLAGELPQGRIGVGPALLRDLEVPPGSGQGLTVLEVHRRLDELAGLSGAGVTQARKDRLGALLARTDRDGQQFLKNLLVGELRQGALTGVLVEAVARAAGVPAEALRRAHMLHGSLGEVARSALTEGVRGLARYRLTLFQPVLPMLAQTAADAEDGLARLGRARVERKLDGGRVQVHRQGDRVRVFSRRLHDLTAALPEVAEAALALPVEEAVLDGEALALDAAGRPRSFQDTMRRFRRKLDVPRMRREVPLSTLFFDVLHLDGETLIDAPTEARVEALTRVVPAPHRVPSVLVDDPEAAEDFLDATLAAGHEGVMLKALDAPYEAGRRGAGWLKLKPAHTLDLVVLGAEWGSGRRTGTLSNLHLGARDPVGGGFVMLGKTFKGLTDALLAWQTGQLLAREVARDAWTVYVRPELVVEIAFEGVLESSQYPGGVALRFARVRGYRPDKPADQADTLQTVQGLVGDRPPRAQGLP